MPQNRAPEGVPAGARSTGLSERNKGAATAERRIRLAVSRSIEGSSQDPVTSRCNWGASAVAGSRCRSGAATTCKSSDRSPIPARARHGEFDAGTRGDALIDLQCARCDVEFAGSGGKARSARPYFRRYRKRSLFHTAQEPVRGRYRRFRRWSDSVGLVRRAIA